MSVKSFNASKEQVRNYLLNRSLLHNKAGSVGEVFAQYKCIQVDPINVVARNHELVFWNRVNNFKISDLYTHIYEKRNAYEYWLQLYSFIDINVYPYLSARRNIKKDWQDKFYKQHKKEIDETIEFVKENGPTSSKNLMHISKVGNLFSWNSDSTRTALLEFLWDTGKLIVVHRKNNNKYYDLVGNVLPEELLNKNISEKESVEFILNSYFDYLGIIRKSFLNRVGYVTNLKLKELFAKKLDKGEILNLKINESKASGYFIHSKDVDKFEDLSKENLHDQLNILPPLDPLIIDRRIVKDFFDFEYTWEAYVPKLKRKFGYYGMPILYKGEFIGQIDLKKDKSNKLDVLKLDYKGGKQVKSKIDNKIFELEELIKG
jgi:uncharacterized protein YcaQ